MKLMHIFCAIVLSAISVQVIGGGITIQDLVTTDREGDYRVCFNELGELLPCATSSTAPIFDYHDYIGLNVESKTWASTCDTWPPSYYSEFFSMPSPDIQIKTTYAEPKEGEARREDKYRLAEDAYVAIERRYYDSSGDLQQTVTYHPPAIQVLTSEMRLGQLWGAGYPYTSVDNVSGITDEKFGATRRELVGVQNIDVPAGEFND